MGDFSICISTSGSIASAMRNGLKQTGRRASSVEWECPPQIYDFCLGEYIGLCGKDSYFRHR